MFLQSPGSFSGCRTGAKALPLPIAYVVAPSHGTSFAVVAADGLHPLCPALGAAAQGDRITLSVFAGD